MVASGAYERIRADFEPPQMSQVLVDDLREQIAPKAIAILNLTMTICAP
jgi:hypothetical protein